MTLKTLIMRLRQIQDANDDEFSGRLHLSLRSGIGGIEFEETAEGHHFFGAVFKDKSVIYDAETLATEEGLRKACESWGYKYPEPKA